MGEGGKGTRLEGGGGGEEPYFILCSLFLFHKHTHTHTPSRLLFFFLDAQKGQQKEGKVAASEIADKLTRDKKNVS